MSRICRVLGSQLYRSCIANRVLNHSIKNSHNVFIGQARSATFIQQRLIQTSSILFSKVSDSDILSRVVATCKDFDKINADVLTAESNFIKDLGLDSLDHVEIILSIEDEFGFEIPESAAEKLHTPNDIAKYVIETLNKKNSV